MKNTYFLYLSAEVLIFWIYWVNWAMLVKLVIPVSFYLFLNIVTTRKFKITRVAHIILLLDRIALDIAHVPCSRFLQEEKTKLFCFHLAEQGAHFYCPTSGMSNFPSNTAIYQ